MNKFGKIFNKINFKLKEHSPEILITMGVIGLIGSGVYACVSTTKLKGITDKHKNDIDKINEYNNNSETHIEQYSPADYKKDITLTNTKMVLNVAKLYAPAVILGSLSVASIFAGNNISRKRNIALVAAYTAVDSGFKKYRQRVTEQFGAELDKELKTGVKAKEIEETTVDEKGKSVTKKTIVNTLDPATPSDYSRFYDCGCIGWSKNPESNLFFLKQQQNWANNKLKAKGYLFLNEVYESLGLPVSEAGCIVGWVLDETNPNIDNYVDFGIYEARNSDFVNGYERTVLLDFNVDGPIYNNNRVFHK